MLWLYKGDAEAGAYFADGAAASNGWSDAVSQNIDSLSVPITGGAGASSDAGVSSGNSTVPVQSGAGADETAGGDAEAEAGSEQSAGGDAQTEVEAGSEQNAGGDADFSAPQDGQGDDASSAPNDDQFAAPAEQGQDQPQQGWWQ